jgi:hypothetical protein
MQFNANDHVRLKLEHRSDSARGLELGDTVVQIVRFEVDAANTTCAVCAYPYRNKAQIRSIPVDMLEIAIEE